MKPLHALVLLAIVALSILGLYWITSDDSPLGPSGGEPAATKSAAAPLAAEPGVGAGEREALATVAGSQSEGERGIASGPLASDQETPIEVRGRVVFPEPVTADPTLTVFALDLPCRYADFVAAREHPGEEGEPPQAVLLRRQIAAAILDSSAVDREGRFTVLFPEGQRRGFLIARGRYLYLPRAEAVDLVGLPEEHELTLNPLAGAWIHGRLTYPEGFAPAEGDARVRLFSALSGGPMGFGGQPDSFSGLLAAAADGSFEFQGVPAREPYTLTAVSAVAAGVRERLGNPARGEELELAIALTPGAAVSGVVVDGAGRPVAEALVSAWSPGLAFGLDDERLRRTQSDERGRYRLAALPTGRVKISADHPLRLDSAKVAVQVPEEGELTEVDLVLEDGRRIIGRALLESGAPAAGARVRAWFDITRASGPSLFNASRGARSETLADDEGRFVLSGLGAGPFVVSAEVEAPEGGAAGQAPWTGRADGALPSEVPLTLVLRPPLALRGRVVDSAGVPVPAFEVSVRREVMGEFVEATAAYRRASVEDEEGRFALEGMESGTWTVDVSGPNLVAAERPQVVLPQEGDPVEVRVVRSATAQGKVLDSDGDPVQGARVHLAGASVGWQMVVDPFPDAPTTQSGEQGEFTLSGLSPGRLSLVAEAAGYAPSEAVALDLEEGALADGVVLRLTDGGRLVGRVYDEEGKDARGWVVIAFHGIDFSQRLASTDGGGHFAIDHMRPGSWMVVAMNPAMELQVGEEGIDMSSMMGQFEMTQARIVEGEETHVVIGAPPEDPVRIFGKVTLAGEAYRGAVVSFIPEGSGLYENMSNCAVGEDGGYEMTLDGPGNYIVSIQALSSATGQQSSIEYLVEVPEREEYEHDFDLPRGRISGRVLGPGRRPAAGARVTLTPDREARTDAFFGGHYTEIATDGAGAFDVKGLRPGTYRLSVGGSSPWSGALQTPYGRVVTGGLELDEGEWLRDIELRLEEPGTLDVTVLDAAGHPLPQASVFVRDAAGHMLEPLSMVTSDDAGHCEYTGIAPGEVTVSARVGPLTCEESAPVTVGAGKRTAVTLHLEQGSVLWVRLKDSRGDPAAGLVSVTDEAGRELTGMVGVQDLQVLYLEGAFSPHEHRVGPLPPGRYRVSGSVGGKTATKTVRLRGEPEKKVTLRMR